MIIQRLFSSKEQKARKEKYEVLKGQDLVDQRNRGFHKTADEVLNQADREKLPENHPKVRQASELKARAIINDQLSQEVKKDPKIGTNFTNGREGILNQHKVFNKRLARSGMNLEEFIRSGGIIKRNEQNKKRPRGVKKARGEKTQTTPRSYNSRFKSLNKESQNKLVEKIETRRKVKASIAKHEAKVAELRAKKEAGKMLKKGGKIALATGGAVAAGIGAKKLYDKKKKKK